MLSKNLQLLLTLLIVQGVVSCGHGTYAKPRIQCEIDDTKDGHCKAVGEIGIVIK